MSTEDDEIVLSSAALAALQQFYAEQQQAEQLLQTADTETPIPISVFQEDWQLSQFWYAAETAERLAQEVRTRTPGRIACVACPTLFAKLNELEPRNPRFTLLEYDRRFEVYGAQFVFYDYRNPVDGISHLPEHSFDLVIADPPFLAQECMEKTIQTVKYLAKGDVIFCTGAIMEPVLKAHFPTINRCVFRPQHANNLSNEFRCFSTYASSLGVEETPAS
eukprot:m.316846 g.316846  ORF g.316846 m.316846 type:complete len:220 (-) comp55466_c0_seq1:128-787(-)